MPLHTEAWRAYLDQCGLPYEDLEEKMHGRRNDVIVLDLFGTDLEPAAVFAHGAAKEKLWRQMMAPCLEQHLVPGIRELLEQTPQWPKAVGSNAEPANIEFVLDGANLRSYFQVIVDGHQVQRPKPYPDVYLRAAELLGIKPGNCVVFEDSPAGVEAARSAGTRVAGVQTHGAPLPGADVIIHNFLDPALEPWLRSLQPRE